MPMDSTDREGLPEWVVADLFAASTRERVLCLLHRANEPVPLCDVVAELVASANAGVTHEEVRMTLFQEHLPKLTATGAVEIDSARGTLALGEAGNALAPHLADCGEA